MERLSWCNHLFDLRVPLVVYLVHSAFFVVAQLLMVAALSFRPLIPPLVGTIGKRVTPIGQILTDFPSVTSTACPDCSHARLGGFNIWPRRGSTFVELVGFQDMWPRRGLTLESGN